VNRKVWRQRSTDQIFFFGGWDRKQYALFRHKTNQDILPEIKTQSVLVQTNSRNSGQTDIVKR
jgi:hypothetical protein